MKIIPKTNGKRKVTGMNLTRRERQLAGEVVKAAEAILGEPGKELARVLELVES